MKRFHLYALCSLLLTAIVCGCSDELDVINDYGFTVEHLPVPKKLNTGETAEIRCRIVKEGDWQEVAFQLRYFQPDGYGKLHDEAGTVFLPNDLYDLKSEMFRLYYTSLSEETQNIDIYFLDNSGNMCTLSFSFNNDNTGTDE